MKKKLSPALPAVLTIFIFVFISVVTLMITSACDGKIDDKYTGTTCQYSELDKENLYWGSLVIYPIASDNTPYYQYNCPDSSAALKSEQIIHAHRLNFNESKSLISIDVFEITRIVSVEYEDEYIDSYEHTNSELIIHKKYIYTYTTVNIRHFYNLSNYVIELYGPYSTFEEYEKTIDNLRYE